MMSSFSEKSVAAGTETQDSLTQNPMQSGYGTDGGADNGASAEHATTVYQPEGVVLTNPKPNMIDQNEEYTPLLCQPEAVILAPALEVVAEVMNVSGVVPSSVDVNESNGNSLSNEVVNKVLNDPNNNVALNGYGDVKDENNNQLGNVINEVVDTSSVVGNLNNNNNSGSYEVVTPSVVVNYQNNGIGNNAVAINNGVGDAIKRKRGRPRKYPIGQADLTGPVPVVSAMQLGSPALVQQESSEKRGRGRPAGSGKKHKPDAHFPVAVSPANSGLAGAGFLPYIITVRSGEYVQPKLLSLSQADKQVVCVLSASGTISNVTLQQPESSGGTVTYQGHFEILSLSGSFLLSEFGGQRSITGGLSVSLAKPNGCIFGGGVAGPLIADSDVQIIAGTFLASEENLTRPGCTNVLTPSPNHVSSVGGSPPSRALLSESSGVSRSTFNHSNGGWNNGNQHPVSSVAWM